MRNQCLNDKEGEEMERIREAWMGSEEKVSLIWRCIEAP